MQISVAIRRAREALGITQIELAKRCKVAPSTVAGWEMGTHGIRSRRFPQIARALGVDMAELLAS